MIERVNVSKTRIFEIWMNKVPPSQNRQFLLYVGFLKKPAQRQEFEGKWCIWGMTPV